MKKLTPLSFRCLALCLGLSLASTPTPSNAATYYWDEDAATAGFGTAGNSGINWSGTTSLFSTDSNGTTAPSGTQVTATTDSVNFGTASAGLAAGTINVGAVSVGNITFGSASGAITLSSGTISMVAAQTTAVNNASDTIGSVLAGAGTSFTKTGSGALNLSGGGTVGNLFVSNGTLNVTAGTLAANGAFSGVGNTASTTGIISTSSGATLTWGGNNGGNFGGANAASGVFYNAGVFNQTGALANSAGIYLGNGNNGYGYLRNSGTVNVAGRIWISQNDGGTVTNGANGVLDVVAGKVNVVGTNQTAAIQVNDSNKTYSSTSGYAGVNIAGGGWLALTPSQTYQINTGANLYSSLNVSGIGSKITTGTSGGFNLNNTSNASNTTTFAIANGGEVDTSFVNNTGSALSKGILGFNNGTLKATAAGTLISNAVTTQVQSGGAILDNGGFTTTVAASLQAPSGNGVTAITGTYSGFVGAPVVKITDSTGVGASAIASFDPATGNVTVTVTNPGSGYTSPTISLVGGMGGATGANNSTSATFTTGAVNSGGVTFLGSGTTMLTGANTYTGSTALNAGTVIFGGTSNIGAISVADGATMGIRVSSPGASVVSSSGLTLGATGASNLAFDFSSLGNPSAPIIDLASNPLALNGTVNVTLSNFSTLSSASDSLKLIGFGTQTGVGTFNLTTTTAGHTSFALNDTATALYLNISAATNTWSGAINGTWDIGTSGGATGTKNWSVSDQVYLDGDKVVFDDNASQFNVNLASSVNPGTVIFANSGAHVYKLSGAGIAGSGPVSLAGTNGTVIFTNTNSYTGATTIAAGNTLQLGDGTVDGVVSGSSSIVNDGALVFYAAGSSTSASIVSGSGSLVKNGAGSLTLSAASSFSGGSSLNAGKLILNNNSALGSGTLTVNGGTLDSTVSGVTVNNAQAWNGNFAIGGSQNLTFSGSVALNADSTVAVNAGTLTVSGPIGGSFALGKSGTGTLSLSAANSYSGATVLNGGVLVAANNAALGTGTLSLTSGTLTNTYNNFARSIPNPISATGSASISAASGGDLTLSGNLSGNGTLNLSGIFNAAGLLLAGSNSGFTGTMAVLGANVRLNAANAVGASAKVVVDGNLQLNVAGATTYEIGELSSTVATGGISAHAHNASATVSTLSVGALNTDSSFSGLIVDNPLNNAATGNLDTASNNVIAFTKVGTGNLTLSGNNTYTGPTNVNGGTLTVNGVHSGAGLVTVASGASLGGGGSVAGSVIVSGGLSGSLGVGGDLSLNPTSSMSGNHSVTGNVTLNNSSLENVTGDLDFGLTLSGTGGTQGNVSATHAGNVIAPGNSGVGNIALGSLSTATGAHLSMDILGTTAGGYDTLTIASLISLSGGDLTLNLGSFVPGAETLFLIVNSQGGVGGDFGTVGNFDSITFAGTGTGSLVSGAGEEGTQMMINGAEYTLTYSANFEGNSLTGGNDIALIAAVPEPSTWVMLVGGIGMLVSRIRRRK